MTSRSKRYISGKKVRGVIMRFVGGTNHIVRLSSGELVSVLQDEPVQVQGGYVYTVKIVNENQ